MQTEVHSAPASDAAPRTAPYQLLASMLLVAAPIVVFSHPVLLDYQNHLARIWIIAGGDAHRGLVPFFRVEWRNITSDLGIDLVAQALRGLLSPDRIARLCLMASVLLPMAGTVALNARIYRGFNSYQLILPFFAWTLTALAGFLNFQIGLGLALLFAAVDPALQRRGPWLGALGRVALGMILFLDHPLALAFYACLLAASAFGAERLKASPEPVGKRLLRAVAAVGICLIPILLLSLLTHTAPGNREAAAGANRYWWNGPYQIATALSSPLITYNIVVDLGIAALLAAVLGFAVATGKLRAHVGLLSLAILLTVLAAFMPSATSQSGWTDRRLPVMALLTAISAIQISFPKHKRAELAFSVMAFLLIAGRTAWIAWNWRGSERLSESVSAAIAGVPPGASILPLEHEPTKAELDAPPPGRFIFRREPTYRHLATMAIFERHAFVPNLFSQRGVHPIEVNPPWDQIIFREGGNPSSVASLTDPKQVGWDTPYVRQWKTRFDYVLVLNADFPDDNGVHPLPPELKLEKDAGFAVLYRIVTPRAPIPAVAVAAATP
jgi:hypothetical protein